MVEEILHKATKTVGNLLKKFENVQLPPERIKAIIEYMREEYMSGRLVAELREAGIEPTQTNVLFYIFATLEGLGLTGEKAIKAAAYITGQLPSFPYEILY